MKRLMIWVRKSVNAIQRFAPGMLYSAFSATVAMVFCVFMLIQVRGVSHAIGPPIPGATAELAHDLAVQQLKIAGEALFCGIVAVACWWSFIRRGRTARRRENGLCPSCGYDVRASTDRCPECGSKISQAAYVQ